MRRRLAIAHAGELNVTGGAVSHSRGAVQYGVAVFP